MASVYLAQMILPLLVHLAAVAMMDFSSVSASAAGMDGGAGRRQSGFQPSSAMEHGQIPTVSSDSLLFLNPGDRLQLIWWGVGSGQVNLVVGSRGDVVVPDVGAFHVRGVPFNRVRDTIEGSVRKRIKTEYVELQVVSLAPAEVNLIGVVANPGSYTVRAGTRLSSFLAEAHVEVNSAIEQIKRTAPTRVGDRIALPSFREVELIRGSGKDTLRCDLVKAVRGGDFQSDPPLFSGDIVRLKEQGAMIGVSAPLPFGGYYEYRSGESLASFLAGNGIEITGKSSGVEVLGAESVWKPAELASPLSDDVTSIRMQIARKVPPNRNVIWVVGWVRNPGAYLLEPDMNASEAVKRAGGSFGGGDSAQVLSVKRGWGWIQPGRGERMELSTNYPEVKSLLLEFQLHMRGNYSSPQTRLQEGDSVFVYQAEHVVWVGGRIAKQGYVTWRSGASIKDYIAEAGGTTGRAWLSRAVVYDMYTDQQVPAEGEIRPGSVILIPEKPYTPPLQWVSMLSTIAVSLLSIILLTQQLTD